MRVKRFFKKGGRPFLTNSRRERVNRAIVSKKNNKTKSKPLKKALLTLMMKTIKSRDAAMASFGRVPALAFRDRLDSGRSAIGRRRQ